MKILTDPRSGSYQGITSSRNRFGQYVRTRAIPVQPRTPKQTANRAFFVIGSSAWKTLSDAERQQWNDYAAQIERSDSLGSNYSPTGAELYTGSVIALQQTGQTVPPLSLPVFTFRMSEMTYTDPTPGPEALDVTVEQTDPNNEILIQTSGPVSPGITSAAAVRRWRSLPANANNMNAAQFSYASNPMHIITEYKLLFGSPLTGQVIFFRFTEVFNDGVTGAAVANRQKQTFRFVVP